MFELANTQLKVLEAVRQKRGNLHGINGKSIP